LSACASRWTSILFLYDSSKIFLLSRVIYFIDYLVVGAICYQYLEQESVKVVCSRYNPSDYNQHACGSLSML
jgi:hypothetical protein